MPALREMGRFFRTDGNHWGHVDVNDARNAKRPEAEASGRSVW